MVAGTEQGLRLLDDERLRTVLTDRVGVQGAPRTLEAIGNELGITRERVRQIQVQAVDTIHAAVEFQKIKDAILTSRGDMPSYGAQQEYEDNFREDVEEDAIQGPGKEEWETDDNNKIHWKDKVDPEVIDSPDQFYQIQFEDLLRYKNDDAQKMQTFLDELSKENLSREKAMDQIEKFERENMPYLFKDEDYDE